MDTAALTGWQYFIPTVRLPGISRIMDALLDTDRGSSIMSAHTVACWPDRAHAYCNAP